MFSEYKATHDNQVPCSPGQKPPAGKVCQFNVTDATGGFCTPEKDYGYYEGRPCVLLKMNKARKVLYLTIFVKNVFV